MNYNLACDEGDGVYGRNQNLRFTVFYFVLSSLGSNCYASRCSHRFRFLQDRHSRSTPRGRDWSYWVPPRQLHLNVEFKLESIWHRTSNTWSRLTSEKATTKRPPQVTRSAELRGPRSRRHPSLQSVLLKHSLRD